MPGNLLVLAYPQEDDVLTSFRFASKYTMPDLYTGNATLTQISSSINSTGFSLLFRCEGCLSWDQDGTTGNASTSASQLLLGWAQAEENPTDGACPDDLSLVKHEANSLWIAKFDRNATSSSYNSWAKLATNVVTGDCDGGGGNGNGTKPRWY
jgi:cellobiose dehydrogenase (acceptor)